MKAIHLFFIICSILLPSLGRVGGGSCYAQNYQWVTGGGSSTSMSISRDWEYTQYMCTDDIGNVYTLSSVGDDNIKTDTFYMAHSHNTGSGTYPHLLFASYSCKGKLRWAKLLESSSAAERYGIVYNKGSVYLHGGLRGNNKYIGNDTFINNQYLNLYIAGFDTSGQYKWIKFIGPDSFFTAYRTGLLSGWNSMAIDGIGNIHLYDHIGSGIQITPTIRSIAGVYDIKYDTAGNLLGAVKMQIDSSMKVNSVTMNNTTVYARIDLVNVSTVDTSYVAAFNSSGSQLWADTIRSGSVFDIAFDGNHTIYGVGGGTPLIVGRDTVTKTYYADFIKLDTNGKASLVSGFYGSGAGLYRIAILPNHQLAATTHVVYYLSHGTDTITSLSGQHPVLCIVDTSDNLIKLDQFTSGGFYDWGTAITADKAGNIFIGGQVQSFIKADTNTFTSTGGNSDFFVAKYGYSCHCDYTTVLKDSFTVSGANKHVPDTVHFTYAGSSGIDSMRWYFGDGKTDTSHNPIHIYTDTGTLHVCLTIYGCDSVKFCKDIKTLPPVAVRSVNSLTGVSVYPNPISGAFFVDGAEMGTAFRLFNIMGQLIIEGVITDKKQQINTGDLRLGSYLLELTDKQGSSMHVSLTKE